MHVIANADATMQSECLTTDDIRLEASLVLANVPLYIALADQACVANIVIVAITSRYAKNDVTCWLTINAIDMKIRSSLPTCARLTNMTSNTNAKMAE